MKKQWHPTFARLLRPLLEPHYEVRTNVPVSDVPRAADVVLLRRASAERLPFTGVWRNLTPWNVLEFKGPTVSARVGDIDLLVELGLGIHRRLNEECAKRREPGVEAADVSYWYLANHLGRRFLRDARLLLALEAAGPGVWRGVLLVRPMFFVSGTDLPVDQDSLPMHIIGKEPEATERAVAEFVMRRPELVRTYGGFLATLHPGAWKEVEAMAKTKSKGFDFDMDAVVELIERVGTARVIEGIGLERVIQAVGVDRVIESGNLDRVIEEKGVEWFLARISPERRRQLKEHLK